MYHRQSLTGVRAGLLGAAGLMLCAAVASAQSITGTVAYRERMALPAGAVLEVTLADVSRADAPAELIATSRVPSPGAPPIPFALAYEPSRIVSNRQYVVRARIVVGDRLLFTTDTATPVITRGAPTKVSLMLRRGDVSQATPARQLVGTYWRATELAGKPVATTSAALEAHLVFESGGRVSGSDGCNRVTGTYELTGDRVTFGRMAGTMRACLKSPGTEQPFRAALNGAARLVIVGDRLELSDRTGARLATLTAAAQPPTTGGTASGLTGTSWQLVRFEGGDGSVLTPDERAKYTVALEANGRVAARIDCNRGSGTWKSGGTSQLQFGPLALTRAQCPPGSLHDQIVRQWANIRSYVLRDGHLFLSLMADGGIYEFEPVAAPAASFRSAVQSRGPATWTCTRAGVPSETLRVTFHATQPALVLLERAGVTKPAFQVRAASGARYEGDELLFWEARGQATLNWMGVESICKPN